MTYLLDTCVISKLRKLKAYPDPKLTAWILKHPDTVYHISVVTLGEIQAGITKLNTTHIDQQRYRMMLEEWLFGELVPYFSNRILDITAPIAFKWGKMSGNRMQKGNKVPVADGLIAATALHHGLILVTDNTKDFKTLGVELINPWSDTLNEK